MFTLDFFILNLLKGITAQTFFNVALCGMIVTYSITGYKQSKKKGSRK